MEGIQGFYGSLTEYFAGKEVMIPAIEMIYYVVLINLCMLLRRYRLCLLISLIFSFYWMFALNKEVFFSPEGNLEGGGSFAIGFVGFVLFLSLCSFFLPEKKR